MEAKKILTIVFSAISFVLLTLCVVWLCLNWTTFKHTLNGAKIYTHDDVVKSHEDGYNTGIKDKKQLETTISEYREKISALTTEVEKLKTDNKDNTTLLATYEAQLIELQTRVAYYEKLIEAYGNVNKLIATFMYNEQVYAVQLYDADANITIDSPADTDNMQFNGWKVDGELIDLNTYQITQDTTFVADITYSYNVEFVVEDESILSLKINKGNKIETSNVLTPTKTGYDFNGWILNDNESRLYTTNEVKNLQVNENMTFKAKFTVHTYTVTIDWGNSPFKDTYTSSYEITYGETLSNIQPIADAIEGKLSYTNEYTYSFNGFFLDDVKLTLTNGSTYNYETDIALVAKWIMRP